LDGLEVSILKLSEALNENTTTRIDSEYFKKIHLHNAARLKEINAEVLHSVGQVRSGKRIPLGYTFSDEGIPYIRAEDVKDGFINYENSPTISLELHSFLDRYQIKHDEVAITIVGTVGQVGIVKFDLEKCNLTENCVKITSLRRIQPDYLFCFLASSFGKNQMFREQVGTVQAKLSIERINLIKLPVLGTAFQTEISKLVNLSYQQFEASKIYFTRAEHLILERLGLLDWQPRSENAAVKSFCESFLKTGRLDAEYYHPEKTRMLELLDKFPGKTAGSYVSEIDEVINPLNELEPEPVMNFDLNDALPIYLDARETELADELGSSKKTFKRGDVVVSRLRSYLKEIAIVDTPDDAKTVGSSEFIVLRPSSDQISAEALVVYLRSLPVQLILKWCQSGSNHPRFAEKDLLTIKIPDIVLNIQDTLQSNVRQSIDKSRESKRLLETAKRSVEIAIEESEDAAMEYIQQNS
jgi:restriction endonuclease S subunit